MLKYEIMKGRNLKENIMIKNSSRVDFSLPEKLDCHASLTMTKKNPTTANATITPHPNPVLKLLQAHRVSHLELCSSMLNLFAIRTRFAPSVRNFALTTPLRCGKQGHKAHCVAPVPFAPQGAREKKCAFTLAEVLITLGIIGVVAAMTMPALITKYQKKVTSQKLKKFYTVMSQAIKLSEVENGPYPDWAPVTDGGNLPVEELITWYNTYLDKYIVSIDKRKPDSSHYQVAFKDGSGMNFYVNDHDKCIYIFYCTDYKHCDSESYNGRTTFLFKITVDPNGKHFGPSYRSELYTRERLLNDCKHPQTNNDDKRHACSGLLQYDGWEFKDDYPWNAEIN